MRSRASPEASTRVVERFGLFRFIGDDLDVVDPLEHGSLAVVVRYASISSAARRRGFCQRLKHAVRCMGFRTSIYFERRGAAGTMILGDQAPT